MHPFHVALGGLGLEGHGAVDPDGDRRRLATRQAALEALADLDREGQAARLQLVFEVAGGDETLGTTEVAGLIEGLDIASARGTLIAVQDPERQTFDVDREAVAENDHEQTRRQEGRGQQERVA